MHIFTKRTSLIVFFFVLLALSLTACGSTERDPLETPDFVVAIYEKGYEVEEVTDQFPEGAVERVILAYKDDYQIEFFELPTAEQTRSAYQENVTTFENDRGSSHTSSNKNVGNYGYFKQTSNNQFYVVAYIENTMIYAVVPQDFKDEVNSVIEELGYLSKTVARN